MERKMIDVLFREGNKFKCNDLDEAVNLLVEFIDYGIITNIVEENGHIFLKIIKCII